MAVLSRPGVDLHYDVRGAGQTVLCVHGTPSGSAFWAEPAHRLARLCRCVTYDRRGFGDSRPERPLEKLDLVEHVADAAALVLAVGGTPVVVLGRSTGGLIALALAQWHPELVRALVLLEPAAFALDHEALAWAQSVREAVLAAEVRRPGAASRAVLDLALGQEAWPSLPAEVQQLFAACAPAVLAEVRGRGLDLSADPWTPDVADLDLPVLLVSATESYPAARRVDLALAAALPDVRHVMVPGGHIIDPAGPDVVEFLGAQPPAGGE